MSFEEGKINLTFFLLEKNPYKPKELLKKLSTRAVASSDLTLECQGWASGKVLLDSRIDEESCMNEMYPILNWRKQYRLTLPRECKTFTERIVAIKQFYEAFEQLFKEWKREEQHAAGMDFLPGLEE